jgi:hypothetical protein
MPKGGPREGAGRPRGSRGKRTRDSIAKAERAEAVEYASIAAPYVHPKVTPSPASAPVYDEPDYSVLSDAELEQMEKLFSKALEQPPAGEAPAAQSRVRRGRYPRAVMSGAQ